MLPERQNQILEIAKESGRVNVESLASLFGVTPQTIRKDLNDLCDRGLLDRVHGGAIIGSTVENVGYEARRLIARDAKRSIGLAAAALIPNNASLLINIGTTTEEVAKALRHHQGVLAITNNINAANILRAWPGIEVIIASGVVRRSDGGIIGEAAVEFIRRFKVDYAVIGASAIDADGSLMDYDYREVSVARTIMENARKVILVADATKFERAAPVRIAHVSAVDVFVTDRLPAGPMRQVLQDAEVEVVETQGRSAT
ncbi:transcriptional regulator, DeoR family [Tistlia consotensis]|uniref:Transcriptional regulator, DeoR family n=1 Tax=Tistlia consotensis USBA 355 TaxID=560819 RepID=A0A1Y6BMT2_9PROT|nr:DeoR/GlpR family DNA-binding transcription regulator [Tistlia consotensis]SMF18794.1 transcriptional regulator, DeoR family [Tistlia consotensis USBA 355]SNR39413.1 transcriptional regulator, DeoR family [Tistlia consotensis]